ncbi:hypothetical protein MMC28_002566 [Mycoblastus sanguinarius]|nr:hypothetical protein [Mycoblastus sanguinarius]
MAPQVEIAIPNTQISNTAKPYTLYNITLRLPLRTFTVQKRYSDFTSLDSALTSQAGAAPPTQLPSKSWFARTTSSPEFTEERRKGLEAYVKTVNATDDERWRNTSAWRTFLNLPSNNSLKSSLASKLRGAVNGISNGQPITDPVVWLDHHRNLKSELHDARLHITRRDQAPTAQAQHEASAQAKKCLVRAGTMITALDTGLQHLSSGSTWGASKLGDGELRRRRDLVSSAKREKEGLETLNAAMVAKSQVDQTVASAAEKTSLMGPRMPSSSRVLGKETDKTRALDNNGVVQLQKQLMQDQDQDVTVLARAVARQKELGVAIQEELEVQNEMLGMLDEDVTRVQGKMDVARKRIGKIS